MGVKLRDLLSNFTYLWKAEHVCAHVGDYYTYCQEESYAAAGGHVFTRETHRDLLECACQRVVEDP